MTPVLRTEIRQQLALGLPLVGSQVAQIAIGMTDVLMIGWYDVTALAAIAIASSLFHVVYILAAGFSWAAMPLIATAAELDDTARLRRVTRMAMWLSMGLGALSIPVLWWAGPILRSFGQDAEVAQLAQDYLRIVAWSLLPHMLVMALRSHLSGLERANVILWVTIGAAVLNVAVNYVLIFGRFGAPELGIQGAAVASLSVASFMALGLVIYENRCFAHHALFQRLWRPDFEALREVFRLGWPVSLTHVSETALFGVAAIFIGWVGVFELAAHGVAIQIAALTFVVHLGVSQAITVRVGRAFGRSDFEAIRLRAKVGATMSGVFAALTIIVFLTVPDLLVGAFVDLDDPNRPQIIAIGAGLMVMAAVFQAVDAAQVIGLGILRGMQDTRWPMVFAATGYWLVGIPASYLIGIVMGYGAQGVWFGLAIGLAAVSAALIIRVARLSAPEGMR